MRATPDRRDLLAELARIERDRAERHKLLLRTAETLRAEMWREWQRTVCAFAIAILSALIGELIVPHS